MNTTTASHDVARLTADIAARSAEIERRRRLPADVIESLKAAGFLRMLSPRVYGGDPWTLPDVLQGLEMLARADGATAWIVGQVASAQLILSYFPRQALDDIYAAGADLFAAGVVAPKGRAHHDGDRWRITGQWPFVSGCQDASWIYVQAMVIHGHRIDVRPDDTPVLRLAVFPSDAVEILDTWSVSGLRGTGSHDVRLSNAVCPDWRTASLSADSEPSVEGTIFRIPPLDQGGLYIAAVALGIARGAIDDIAALAAGGKRPAFGRERLAASPVFQDRLGDAYLQLEGASALLSTKADAIWTTVSRGDTPPIPERAVLRATAAAVVTTAARVVDATHALAGGSALYDASPLQRRLRDIHAATLHTCAGRSFLGVVGGLLAGETPSPALF